MTVTIRDVATDTGVSVATVSRALSGNGAVGPATRERIAEAAARLGYQPNDLARSLHGGATGTIAVLVPDITNPFLPELVAGIQAVANERENLLLLCQTGEDPATAGRELRHLRRKRVDGVVLVGGLSPDETLGSAVGGLPVVTVDRDAGWPAAGRSGPTTVAGGRVATEHLVELGHERVAHIAGPQQRSVAQERFGRLPGGPGGLRDRARRRPGRARATSGRPAGTPRCGRCCAGVASSRRCSAATTWPPSERSGPSTRQASACRTTSAWSASTTSTWRATCAPPSRPCGSRSTSSAGVPPPCCWSTRSPATASGHEVLEVALVRRDSARSLRGRR